MLKEYLNKLIDVIFPWWKGLTSSKKATFIGFTGLTLVIMIFLFGQIMKTQYQVLYRNLDAAESGEVIDHLKEAKIPYRLSQGGTAILVPGRKIQQVRLELASAGLPRSGSVGYEIFDQTNLGMTDFLQKVNYRRALEGELTKTISRLKEVKSARVHLVIPQPRLFKEDKKEPSASVVLYLNRNIPLAQRQVEGIIYLVASSVEGLSPENITILDSSGRLLSNRRGANGLAVLSSNQLEVKKSIEGYLQDKAQSMLDGVLGVNRSVVRVNADLNFDQLERTTEFYDPDNISTRSEEISEEKQSESEGADKENKRDVTNTKKTTVRNYEVNKTIEHLVNQVGNITRLNVSVSIDGTYKMVKGPDGKVVRQFVSRPQEEIDKLLALVKGAVGFSEKRNDVIEVVNIPFETFQNVWEEDQRLKREEMIKYWMKIGLRILLLIAVVLILLKLRKKYADWSKRYQARRRFLDAQAEVQRKAAEIIPKVSKEPKLIDHVRKIADDNPEEMAKVIKTMMAE